MNFKDVAIKLTAGNAVFGSFGAMAGYLYSAVYALDKKLTIQAFAIASLAINTFRSLSLYLKSTEGMDKAPFLARAFILDSMMGMVGIVAGREMGLIARKGTVALSLAVLVVSIVDLYHLIDYVVD